MSSDDSSGCGGLILSGIGGIATVLLGIARFADGCAPAVKTISRADDFGRVGKVVDVSSDGFRTINKGDEFVDLTKPGAIDDFFKQSDDFATVGDKSNKGTANGSSSGFKQTNLFDLDDSNVPLFSQGEKQRMVDLAARSGIDDFAADLQRFTDESTELEQTFGRKSQLLEDYKSEFLHTGDIKKARQKLLPKEMIDVEDNPAVNEMYGLFKGVDLNQDQAKVLSKILDKDIPATSDKVRNYILMDVELGQKSYARTVNGKVALNTYTDLDKISVRSNSRVIVNGNLSDQYIKYWSKKGVKLIRDKHSFMQDLQTAADDLEFVFVASKDKSKLADLFDISAEQADELMPAINQLTDNKYTHLVESAEELTAQVARLKETSKKPIVVFHNSNNLLFNRKPNDLGIDEYITCNSSRILESTSGHVTTDFIYVEDMIHAVIQPRSPSAETIDDVLVNISDSYSMLLSQRQAAKIKVTLAIGVTITAPGGFAVYYNIIKEE